MSDDGYVVVDSGVVIAVALEERYSPQARKLVTLWIAQKKTIAVPALFKYELIATIRKSITRNRIAQDDVGATLTRLFAVTTETHFSDTLLYRGLEIATLLNRPTAYDSQYLAVAEMFGCEFWTLDEKLYNAANPTFSWVKWVGNIEIPNEFNG